MKPAAVNDIPEIKYQQVFQYASPYELQPSPFKVTIATSPNNLIPMLLLFAPADTTIKSSTLHPVGTSR